MRNKKTSWKGKTEFTSKEEKVEVPDAEGPRGWRMRLGWVSVFRVLSLSPGAGHVLWPRPGEEEWRPRMKEELFRSHPSFGVAVTVTTQRRGLGPSGCPWAQDKGPEEGAAVTGGGYKAREGPPSSSASCHPAGAATLELQLGWSLRVEVPFWALVQLLRAL